HTNAALNFGIAPEQIVEVCTHCIPYAGFPRVLNALFTVKAVFEERNIMH
ncbi:carboxymuconolactone decarboxylase family protein, partial [Veillonella atypica]